MSTLNVHPEPSCGEEPGEHQQHCLAPLAPLHQGLCYISQAPALLRQRFFFCLCTGAMGKTLDLQNKLHQGGAGLCWVPAAGSRVPEPSSSPTARAGNLPPAPASPGKTPQGRESLHPPLTEVFVPHPVVAASSPAMADAPDPPAPSSKLQKPPLGRAELCCLAALYPQAPWEPQAGQGAGCSVAPGAGAEQRGTDGKGRACLQRMTPGR